MKHYLLCIFFCLFLFSCKKDKLDNTPEEEEFFVNEDPTSFAEISSIDIGDVGAAEITAFDPATNRLFVVNNGTVNKIDVIDFKDPSNMKVIGSIQMAPYGGAVNSVAVFGGRIAAAIESTDKQANGKVAVFKTDDLTEVKVINVGALPDMITYSPDGKYIMTANEGEPNDAYTIDPAGTVSIITVADYSVVTIDFSSMAGQKADLMAKGFRIFGIGNDFVKDIEPEYITISADSKTAWVTMQENNGIAKIDIASKTITNIFPLGFKDYNIDGNEIDVTDDKVVTAAKWPVKGVYMPDAIALLEKGGIPYLFTANEGDSREYKGLTEVKRVGSKDVKLDPTIFPTAAALKLETSMGRLNITTTLGDIDGDGDFDALYSLGSRSFSVWNGLTGGQIYDSKNELDVKAIAAGTGVYDDGRSDDKSVEPEGITIGKIGSKNVAFIGLERADAVAVYDVTDPTKPVFLQLLKCGDAPEGVLIIPAKNSPTKKSLLLVSSENDGVIKVYTPKTI